MWGPHLLWECWICHDIGVDVLRRLILDVWSSAEFPQRSFGRDGRRPWLEMFAATGYMSHRTPRPVEPLTVYRGAVDRHKKGMAWTTDPDIARRFADHRGPGTVWQATVPPPAVLGRIDDGHQGRGEKEVSCR
jgi:hypothetical protein